mmetsp:Transcript_10245/g.26846  ORF Transcript_10245/g.26846 Transcript_10245/m.26846 type:complete len:80 (+) Transcript_10245:389-628(+)
MLIPTSSSLSSLESEVPALFGLPLIRFPHMHANTHKHTHRERERETRLGVRRQRVCECMCVRERGGSNGEDDDVLHVYI